MFALILTYISELVSFGSVDLVGTVADYIGTLSAVPAR